MANNTQGRSNRGFASMDYQKQREIASKGGRAAHQQGTAHEFTSEEAREAGRKGGEVVSRDRNHMAEIGRKGGEARSAASRAARSNGQKEMSQGINATQGMSTGGSDVHSQARDNLSPQYLDTAQQSHESQ
jgi:general stress protein YciG